MATASVDAGNLHCSEDHGDKSSFIALNDRRPKQSFVINNKNQLNQQF